MFLFKTYESTKTALNEMFVITATLSRDKPRGLFRQGKLATAIWQDL